MQVHEAGAHAKQLHVGVAHLQRVGTPVGDQHAGVTFLHGVVAPGEELQVGLLTYTG